MDYQKIDPEQLQMLINAVSDRFESVVKDRFKVILEKQDSIQKSLDIISDDSDTDHQDFSQMKISMSSIEQSQKEIIALMNHNTKKVVERVSERAEQIMEGAAQAVANNVEPVMDAAVKKLNNGVPLNRKSWIKRLFGR